MGRRSGPLIWLAQHPRVVLSLGCVAAFVSLVVSYWTCKWHWFPRGGAVMALSGFIVSVQEALLYLSPRPPEYRASPFNPGFGGLVRRGPFGVPVFHPDIPGLKTLDPELTQEEIDKEREAALKAWDEAEDKTEELRLVREEEPGRKMRDLSDLTDEEYSRLRLAAIFGVVGTIVWAFGDLLGGLP